MMTARILLAALVSAWSAAALAQDMPDTNSNYVTSQKAAAEKAASGKDDDSGKTTDYVIAGWSNPTDWQFSMGPNRQPDLTVLRMTRRVPGGVIGIECHRNTGTMEIRMVPVGYAYPETPNVNATLTIGKKSGPVVLTAEPPPSDKHDASLVISDSTTVTDILYAAAAESGIEFRVDIGADRTFGMSMPVDISITEAAARVCDGWHMAAKTAEVSKP